MRTVLSIYENLSMGGIPAVMRQRTRARQEDVRSVLYFQNDRGGLVGFRGMKNLSLHLGIRHHKTNIEEVAELSRPDVIYLFSHYHMARPLKTICPTIVMEYHRSDASSVRQLASYIGDASALNVPTEWSRRYVTRHVPTLEEEVTVQVVPNVVDLIPLSDCLMPRLPKGHHVIWTGQFGEHKNLDDCLRVFSGIRRRLSNAYLHIVLSREWTKAAVKDALARCAHLNILDGVKLYNDLDPRQMAGLVRAVAGAGGINLVTSRRESYGLSIAEGRAYGLPSVSSRVGAIPEHVIHGESGLLFSFGDVPEATRHAVEGLIDDQLRKRLISGMKAQHEADVSAAKVADRFA